MRLFLALILLLPFGLNAATVFTEFYCDSTVGTNINSGSTTNAAATYTSVNGNFNGSSTFTPTDGSTPASIVSAGDWAAIYIDGATNLVQTGSGGYIVRVLSVAAGANGAITVSTTAFSGTAPSSSATGRSIKVGGAWNGPYETINFPFGFITSAATNGTSVYPRCNLKNTSIYSVPAAITHNNAGPMRWEGMSLVPGDNGNAVIQGSVDVAGYVLLTSSAANNEFCNLTLRYNGTNGTSSGVAVTGVEQLWYRCNFNSMRNEGILIGAAGLCIVSCEFYSNNLANSPAIGSIATGASGVLVYDCSIHHNYASSGVGIVISSGAHIVNSSIHDNAGVAVRNTSVGGNSVINCDIWNNGTDGMDVTASSPALLFIANVNLLKNRYGIRFSGAGAKHGLLLNLGLGTGTQTNSSGFTGDTSFPGLFISGTNTYSADVTPWVDPTNGNFSINLTAAKAAGYSSYLNFGTNSPTIGYPDIGAAQSASTNAAAAGGTTAHTFAQ